MPERNLGLAEPPAQEHLAAVPHAVEVAKAIGALELDTQQFQFLDVGSQLRLFSVQLSLTLGQLFRVEVVRGAAPFSCEQRQPLLQVFDDPILADNISDDHPNKW